MSGFKRWFVGYLQGDDGDIGMPGDVFLASYDGWKPHADGSWGSYLKVIGPFSSKKEAKHASLFRPIECCPELAMGTAAYDAIEAQKWADSKEES